MGAYLADNPGRLRQWSARSSWSPSRPTGLTVLHSTEFPPSWTAAQQAVWLRNRDTPGCYHDIADTYGADLWLIPYEYGAWQDGTGSNGMAVSISFVCRTTDWSGMSREVRARTLRAGARCFARQQAWLRSKGYPTTPLRLVSKADSDRGVPGFIYHGHRDPARRSDPGLTSFPMAQFLDECRAALAGDTPEDDMPYSEDDLARIVRAAVWDRRIGHGIAGDPQPAHMVLGDIFVHARAAAANAARAVAAGDIDERQLAAALAPAVISALGEAKGISGADVEAALRRVLADAGTAT